MTDALDKLNTAVSEFAAIRAGEPTLVDLAVVIWESVTLDDDGTAQRCIRYAVPTDNFSLSGTLGLLEAGKHYIRRDMFSLDDEDDE